MAIRLAKEVHELDRKLRSLTRDQGELVASDIENEGRWIIVRLTPNAGYYEGGSFDFKIEFPDAYPEWMPAVTCLTYIYHPNIDPTTQQCPNVCLNILEADNWCEGFGLQGCIIGLLFLLHNPNFDDLINPLFEIRETESEYREDIRKSMNGEKVGFLTGVLDEVFTMFMPKMISIFEKDTSMGSAPLDESDSGDINVAINDSGERLTDDCDTDVMNVTNGSGTRDKLLDVCDGDAVNVAKSASKGNESTLTDWWVNEPKNFTNGTNPGYTMSDGHDRGTVNVAKDSCSDQTSLDDCANDTINIDKDSGTDNEWIGTKQHDHDSNNVVKKVSTVHTWTFLDMCDNSTMDVAKDNVNVVNDSDTRVNYTQLDGCENDTMNTDQKNIQIDGHQNDGTIHAQEQTCMLLDGSHNDEIKVSETDDEDSRRNVRRLTDSKEEETHSSGENVTHTGLYEHQETTSELESIVNINQQIYDTNVTVNRTVATTTSINARENEHVTHSRAIGVMSAERCDSTTGVMENSDAINYSRLESIDYDELLYHHFMDID